MNGKKEKGKRRGEREEKEKGECERERDEESMRIGKERKRWKMCQIVCLQ